MREADTLDELRYKCETKLDELVQRCSALWIHHTPAMIVAAKLLAVTSESRASDIYLAAELLEVIRTEDWIWELHTW